MTRIVSPTYHDGAPQEQMNENILRPTELAHFIGQKSVKENLSILLGAAKKRREPVEHILFYGPPGLGKTTLAHIISKEMGAHIQTSSGPAIEKIGDLAAILTNLQEGDILFIDEIHRLNASLEEILYPAMEDYKLDLIVGQGPSAKIIQINLPRFTLIGATTRMSLLASPLRDRFGAVYHLNFYEDEDLTHIIRRSSHIMNIDIEEIAMQEIAGRSRKTPRIANRILRRVRDFAQMKGNGHITHTLSKDALSLMGVDQFGLDAIDRTILEIIVQKFRGGPVGLATIAAASGEDESTIEDIYEPFLMQIGFLDRTPRGRVATKDAFEHLGAPYLNALF